MTMTAPVEGVRKPLESLGISESRLLMDEAETENGAGASESDGFMDEAEIENEVGEMDLGGWCYGDILVEPRTLVFAVLCDLHTNLNEVPEKLIKEFCAFNLDCKFDLNDRTAKLTTIEMEWESSRAFDFHQQAGNALSAFLSGFSVNAAIDVLHGRKQFTTYNSKCYESEKEMDVFSKFMKSCHEMMTSHEKDMDGEELIFNGSVVHIVACSGFLDALEHFMVYVSENQINDLKYHKLFTIFWELAKTCHHSTPQGNTMLTSPPIPHTAQVAAWAFAEQYYLSLNKSLHCICKFYGESSVLHRPGGLHITIGRDFDKLAYIIPTSISVKSVQKEDLTVYVTGGCTMKDHTTKNFAQTFILNYSKSAYLIVKDDFRFVDTIPETVPNDPPDASKNSCASIVMKPPSKTSPVYDNGSINYNVPERVHGYSIHMRCLPLRATVQQIEEFFKRFGEIAPNGVQVKIKGGFCYGFVEFVELESMRKALNASPVFIYGGPTYVEEK